MSVFLNDSDWSNIFLVIEHHLPLVNLPSDNAFIPGLPKLRFSTTGQQVTQLNLHLGPDSHQYSTWYPLCKIKKDLTCWCKVLKSKVVATEMVIFSVSGQSSLHHHDHSGIQGNYKTCTTVIIETDSMPIFGRYIYSTIINIIVNIILIIKRMWQGVVRKCSVVLHIATVTAIYMASLILLKNSWVEMIHKYSLHLPWRLYATPNPILLNKICLNQGSSGSHAGVLVNRSSD